MRTEAWLTQEVSAVEGSQCGQASNHPLKVSAAREIQVGIQCVVSS
jgi:hypothetical protein